MNTFGNYFRATTFGESHGPAMGVVIDGCPAGLTFDIELLKGNLARRRPGQSTVVSSRNEADEFELLSGVFGGKTLGTPIAMVIKNQDVKSEAYIDLPRRAGHADDVWMGKYGISDYRGGGRASGRETVCRVLAGSVAQMLVKKLSPETSVEVWMKSVGPFALEKGIQWPNELTHLLENAKIEGESYGGWIEASLKGVPAFLGQPVFKKFKSDITQAVMTIGAVNAVQLGAEIDAQTKGTEYHTKDVYGGIRGGITTGEEITFSMSMKPTSSILDVAKKGRHDPCILPRAIPVIESMLYLILADHLLARRLDVV
jgi:chorismate synthase